MEMVVVARTSIRRRRQWETNQPRGTKQESAILLLFPVPRGERQKDGLLPREGEGKLDGTWFVQLMPTTAHFQIHRPNPGQRRPTQPLLSLPAEVLLCFLLCWIVDDHRKRCSTCRVVANHRRCETAVPCISSPLLL